MIDQRQIRMNDLEKDIDSLFTRTAAKVGLSDSAFDILYALEAYGDGCTQKDLCERCWMGKQTINSSVKRLIEQNVISKEPGAGRTTRIFLTEAGRALVAEKVRPVIDAETQATHEFSEPELDKAIELMERYRNALSNALTAKGLA